MENEKSLMTSNSGKEKCPECGAIEVDAVTPRTAYECGSSDYDQRPDSFKQSDTCKAKKKTKRKRRIKRKYWTDQQVAFVKAYKDEKRGNNVDLVDMVKKTIPSLESMTRSINNGKKKVDPEMLAFFSHFDQIKPDQIPDDKVKADGEKIMKAKARQAENQVKHGELVEEMENAEKYPNSEAGIAASKDCCPAVGEVIDVTGEKPIETQVNQPDIGRGMAAPDLGMQEEASTAPPLNPMTEKESYIKGADPVPEEAQPYHVGTRMESDEEESPVRMTWAKAIIILLVAGVIGTGVLMYVLN